MKKLIALSVAIAFATTSFALAGAEAEFTKDQKKRWKKTEKLEDRAVKRFKKAAKDGKISDREQRRILRPGQKAERLKQKG